ncbi:MAG: Protein N-acetyltransferase, RimJ/RimL family [Pedosphaera sp.]|nr:Protein N-acetyltransferase, RimJ/RimL family [Pedosphaera sp.]
MRQYHEQMLKLVAKGFYNELINYGVNEAEVLTVAGHLLDNVMKKAGPASKPTDYYNRLFAIKDVQDEWTKARRLTVQQVRISPMDLGLIPQIATWLKAPATKDSFYPRFPDSENELLSYFQSAICEYFSIFHGQHFAGIIGAENIDPGSARLEMRKLVGDPAMHGKGIGKRATFLFLYHVFMIRKFRKVCLHSLDINIRNLNLNGKFGFEVEGVFLEEVVIENKRRDVVRMALAAPVWLDLFSCAPAAKIAIAAKSL